MSNFLVDQFSRNVWISVENAYSRKLIYLGRCFASQFKGNKAKNVFVLASKAKQEINLLQIGEYNPKRLCAKKSNKRNQSKYNR